MTKETSVHGNKVLYEDEAKDGINYLDNRLHSDEADVFFYYARNKREAKFRDFNGYQYSLVYDDGEYTLFRK